MAAGSSITGTSEFGFEGAYEMKFGWFNWWNAAAIALLLIPNILYACRHQDFGYQSASRAVNAAEQAGRMGCMVLMVVPLGVKGGAFGFYSWEELLLWFGGTAVLLLAYYGCWICFARRNTRHLALALAILPSALFLLNALLLRHWALGVCAALFAWAHLTTTWQCAKGLKES